MTSTGPETHSNHAIGIDVSKDHLDAFCNHRASGSRFTNTAEGHKDLLTWARPTATTRFAFEPTGAYHIGLETTLGREGHLICKINPHRASLFAKASGRPAKTDQLDARGLAHMAAMDLVQPSPRYCRPYGHPAGSVHAGTGRPDEQPDCQPVGYGAPNASVRSVVRQSLCPWRTKSCPQMPLYASDRCASVQSDHEGDLHPVARRRKATKTRYHGHYEKAHHPRKRPHQR